MKSDRLLVLKYMSGAIAVHSPPTPIGNLVPLMRIAKENNLQRVSLVMNTPLLTLVCDTPQSYTSLTTSPTGNTSSISAGGHE